MEKIFDTLYARDSKGGFKQWNIKVNERFNESGHISIHGGKVGGKLSPRTNDICEGKQGRTAYEQAIFEAESKYRHKKKEGYKSLEDLDIKSNPDDHDLIGVLNFRLPLENTTEDGSIKPMKCQPYFKDDESIRITFPCLGQPKLNGFRCTASVKAEKVGMFDENKIRFQSKHGLNYEILEHIAKDFSKLNIDLSTTKLIFDGEMYIHGEILSEISSAVRKRNLKTPQLKYYIFDLAIGEVIQKARLEMLSTLFNGVVYSKALHDKFTHEIGNIVLVRHEIINDKDEAEKYFNECLEAGYEGAIFRNNTATYKFGQRPQTIAKWKKYEDAEFEILAIIGQEKNPTQALFICKNDKNDLTFKVMSEGTVEKKEEYLKNSKSLVSKKATVRFYERTKNELPFHAIIIDIRDYE